MKHSYKFRAVTTGGVGSHPSTPPSHTHPPHTHLIAKYVREEGEERGMERKDEGAIQIVPTFAQTPPVPAPSEKKEKEHNL